MSTTAEAPARYRAAAARPGPLGLLREAGLEVWNRRRLIGYLVQADVRKKGADTLLGNLWWVIDPLLQMMVYVVLVDFIFHKSVPDYPLFIFAAILPWKWFEITVREGGSSVVFREKLIKQIYFPKLVLPFAATVSGIVNFAFGLIPLVGMMLLLYPERITPWLLLIPVVAFVQLVFSLAVATALSALNVFYRDIGNLSRHLLRFWFYLSPALYGMDQVASLSGRNQAADLWFALNPWTYLLSAYRDLIYYGQAPDWGALLIVLLASIVLLFLCILLFKRLEPSFAKVL